MFKLIVAVFFILHGLVHLLYCGQSQRAFELQSGMVWPDGSWAFSRLLGEAPTRLLATALLALAALGFVAGGVSLLAGLAGWRPLIVAAAAFSALIFVLFWDGGWQELANKGLFAILINAAILAALLLFHWPNFEL